MVAVSFSGSLAAVWLKRRRGFCSTWLQSSVVRRRSVLTCRTARTLLSSRRAELLPARRPVAPRPALLTFDALLDVLRSGERAHLSPSVRMAHLLIAFSAQRLQNAVQAEWSQFDLDAEARRRGDDPRAAMKINKGRQFDHIVDLGATIAGELPQRRSKSLEGTASFSRRRPGAKRSRKSRSIGRTRATLTLAGSTPRTAGAHRSQHWPMTQASTTTPSSLFWTTFTARRSLARTTVARGASSDCASLTGGTHTSRSKRRSPSLNHVTPKPKSRAARARVRPGRHRQRSRASW